ncbi:MAG: CotH kinase family protein [Clostridia bacterium]|nr:CotH kinase family protein [Clostridia bacterium]
MKEAGAPGLDMKRRWICILLLLVMLGMQLCACAGPVEEPVPTPDENPKGGGFLRPDHIMDYTEPFVLSELQGLVISEVYGTGHHTDACVRYSFIQLYNPTDRNIPLGEVSLYHRSGGQVSYREYAFPKDSVVLANHYFLIRCAEATGPAGEPYSSAGAVFDLEDYDADLPALVLDNHENTILLSRRGQAPDGRIAPGDNPDVLCWFAGTEQTGYEVRDIHIAPDMSAYKLARKIQNKPDAYYEVINLSKVGTVDLKLCRPQSSRGDVNTYVFSYLDEVLFSHEAGVYGKALSLELKAQKGYKIYYTTDGSVPTTDSKVYEGPIELGDSSAMPLGDVIQYGIRYLGDGAKPLYSTLPGGYVIKAIASDGTNTTGVFTNSYFILPGYADLYGAKIFSISMPKRNFISSIGFYNRYNASNPRPRSVGYCEVFDESGVRVGHSNTEFGVSGKYSASKLMKSLRIYYKGELNQDNEGQSSLNYDLFNGYARDDRGAILGDYKRLILRNGGNDCGYSYMRDAFSQRLGGLTGVDYMEFEPVLVFVNGEFWGMYNARERYETQYFAQHYGVDKENVTVMESDYSLVNRDNLADYVVSDGNMADGADFNELYHFIAASDLSDDSVYQTVCERLDIDSVIDMYVEHLILGAADWPHNNIKLWRNNNPQDPSGLDTKWRYALLDQDTTLGLSFSYSEATRIFTNAFNENSVTALIMMRLLQNESFRTQFYKRYYQACTQIYTEEKMTDLFYEVYDRVKPLIGLQAERWPGDFKNGEDGWESQMNVILKFIQSRSKYALPTFCAYFHVTENELMSLFAKGELYE